MYQDVLQRVRRTIVVSAATLGVLCSITANAAIIYVDDDAPAGGDGTSWAIAFNDLQLALASAQGSDEIRVAEGIYKPALPGGLRTATFNLVNATTLRGGYAGLGASDPDENNPLKFESILSGDLNGDDGPDFQNITENSFHVLYAPQDIQASTILQGVTVTAGNADSFSFPQGYGAGLHCQGQANPTITQCNFYRNRAYNAGGIYANGALAIQQSVFRQNFLFLSGSGFGAGAYLNGNATISDSLFEGNHAFHGGGGVYGSTVIIRSCVFRQNSGEDGGGLNGGAVILDSSFIGNSSTFYGAGARSTGVFVNCVFVRNVAERGAGLWGSPTAVNCLVAGNSTWSPGAGAGVHITLQGSLINCTIVGNEVPADYPTAQGGGVYKDGAGHLEIRNCAIWNNEDFFGDEESSQLKVVSGTVAVSNSSIQGWTGSLGGTGNHGNDPRFIDADGLDDIYGTEDDNPRPLPNSPLIDHGDNNALPPDTFDLDEDGDMTELIPVDLDSLPRVMGGTVDVGSFEFQGTPCPADITADGAVNVQDMLAMFDAWGSCASGQPCNVDLTLDGIVSVSDLHSLINGWGQCP